MTINSSTPPSSPVTPTRIMPPPTEKRAAKLTLNQIAKIIIDEAHTSLSRKARLVLKTGAIYQIIIPNPKILVLLNGHGNSPTIETSTDLRLEFRQRGNIHSPRGVTAQDVALDILAKLSP